MEINLDNVKAQAKKEIFEEKFAAAVAKEKAKIYARRSFWDIIFPYTIILVKK